MVSACAVRPPILVIADDEELGGLIALNLRRRHLLVEQTDVHLAISPHWFPAMGPPAVAVVNVEKSSTDPLAFLRLACAQPWLRNVPIVLAADSSAAVIAKLGNGTRVVPTKVDDVGAIVGAALALVEPAVANRSA